MKNICLLTLLWVLFASPVNAADHTDKLYVDVNGLVCDFCAQALEKVFAKKEQVESIHVDLDSKVVAITFRPGRQLDDDTISAMIADAGYDVRAIRHE